MKITKMTALALAFVLLCACAAPAEEHSRTVMAMDTVMGITVYGPQAEEAAAAAVERIRELEKLLSVTDRDSEVYAANHSGGAPVTVSDDTAAVISRALALCRDTGGALDVTIYPVVRAWGFTTGEYRVPTEEELSDLLNGVDYAQVALEGNILTVPDGMELDLGAVAKGWTGDAVAALLRESGVTSAKLELGGNVQLLGSKPDGTLWRVGIRDPEGEGYVGILEVEDQAVVTSGGYERYFEENGMNYWHIIDPATGHPAHSGVASATVVADEGALADGLSTALFVMGVERAADLWRERQDFEFVLVEEDGTVSVTAGLAERFSLYGAWEESRLEIVEQ